MSGKKMLLVVNPVSGKGKASKYLLDLISVFSSNKYIVTVYITVNKEKTINDLSSFAHKYDVVVSCGGDGTFSQTINGIIASKKAPKLGYIPLGSANDVARTLDMPADPIECAKRIAKNNSKPFDIGLFNGNPFAYIAATGAFTNVSYSTSTKMKNVFGHPAYIMNGIMELPNIKPKRMRVEFDGNVIEDDFIYASFSNTLSIGGVFNLKDIDTGDGMFELTLAKTPNGLYDTINIIKHATSSDFNGEMLKVFRTSSAKISSDTALEWSIDGEEGGTCNEVTFSNLHGAIELIR